MPRPYRHYPWELWLRYPYQVHEARPGIDFDTDDTLTWQPFYQALKNRAYQTGHLFVYPEGPRPADNPGTLDYVVRFQFYERGHPKPVLFPVIEPGAHCITCTVCGRKETHTSRFAHITECLIANPLDPGDPARYYAHRTDYSEACGFARVVL